MTKEALIAKLAQSIETREKDAAFWKADSEARKAHGDTVAAEDSYHVWCAIVKFELPKMRKILEDIKDLEV